MPVERAHQLLQRLASDPDFLSRIENTQPNEAKRELLNNEGYADVTAADMVAAIHQSRAGTGHPPGVTPSGPLDASLYAAAAVASTAQLDDIS
jgi:hypothetical protein